MPAAPPSAALAPSAGVAGAGVALGRLADTMPRAGAHLVRGDFFHPGRPGRHASLDSGSGTSAGERMLDKPRHEMTPVAVPRPAHVPHPPPGSAPAVGHGVVRAWRRAVPDAGATASR